MEPHEEKKEKSRCPTSAHVMSQQNQQKMGECKNSETTAKNVSTLTCRRQKQIASGCYRFK